MLPEAVTSSTKPEVYINVLHCRQRKISPGLQVAYTIWYDMAHVVLMTS